MQCSLQFIAYTLQSLSLALLSLVCKAHRRSKPNHTSYVLGSTAQTSLLPTANYNWLQLDMTRHPQRSDLLWTVHFACVYREHVDPKSSDMNIE